MAFAREAARSVAFVDGGVIVEQSSPAEMFESPRDPRTRLFLRRILER
jgi:ABC-type polar amino acid transport system ATPase subunit